MLIDRIDRIILREPKSIEAYSVVNSRLQTLRFVRNLNKFIKKTLWIHKTKRKKI